MIVTCPECATRYDVADKAFSAGGRAVRCNHCGCEWYQIGPSGGRPAAIEDARYEAPQPAPAASARGQDAAAERRLPLESSDRLDPQKVYRSGADAGGSAERAKEVARRARSARRGGEAPPPALFDERAAKAAARKGSSLKTVLFPLGGLAVAAAVAAALFLGPSLGLRGGDRGAVLDTAAVLDSRSDPAPAPAAVAKSAEEPSLREGLVFVEFKYDLVERAEGPALEVWGRVANNGPETTLSPTIEIVSKDKNGEPLQRWLAQPEVESIAPGESARFSSRMMYPLEPVHDVDFYIAAR